MKRIIGLMLALAVIFAFAGCGKEEMQVQYTEVNTLTLYFYTGDPGYRRIVVDMKGSSMTVTDYDVDVVDENVYEIDTEELLPFVEERIIPTLKEGTISENKTEQQICWAAQVETDSGKLCAEGLGENVAYPEYWEELLAYLGN